MEILLDYAWRLVVFIFVMGGLVLVAGCCAGAMYITADYVRRWMHAERQELEDMRAHEMVQNIRHGVPVRQFCVYLRSFKMDSHKAEWGKGIQASSAPSLVQVSFDEYLRDSISEWEPLMPLICLGETMGGLGAARVRTTDETWREDAMLLMEHARAIFVVPWGTPGILEEIIAILEDKKLARKTVFLLFARAAYGRKGDNWEKIQSVLCQRIGEVPDCEESGALLNSVGCSVPWSGPAVRKDEFLRAVNLLLESRRATLKRERRRVALEAAFHATKKKQWTK